jgi:outer membrane protein TolC
MKRTIFAVSILSIVAVAGNALDNARLQTIIDTARQNNPEIRSAEKAYRSADNGISAMSAWSDPLVGYEFMTDNNRLYLAQTFPFPGKLSAKKSAASNMALALNQELKQKTLELDAKVKKTFWGYWLANKNLETFNENIDLMKRFLEAAKSKYMVGKVTEADVLAASAELGRMQSMLVMGEYDNDSMRSELNSLMNKSPDEPLGPPEKPEVNTVDLDYKLLEQKALNDNFGIARTKYMYQSSLADSKLSKREWFPDIMAEARISDVPDKSTCMASLQVPLYFWNRTSEIRSKKSLAESAEENIAVENNNVRLALKDMYLQYSRNLKLIKIYETDILPSARQAVEVSESGYRAGKVEFMYLLELQKKYLEFELQYNKLTAESRMYYAELEMLAGGNLK